MKKDEGKKDEGKKTSYDVLIEIKNLLKTVIRENRQLHRVSAAHVDNYTSLEVQNIFSIGEKQLIRWCKAKKIKYVKQGRKYLFPKKPIDKLFEG